MSRRAKSSYNYSYHNLSGLLALQTVLVEHCGLVVLV